MGSTTPSNMMTYAASAPNNSSPTTSLRLIRSSPKRLIDFDWLARAANLPGKTLHVACAIWFVASLHRTPTIRLAPYSLRKFGVSRDCCYDSLRRLADAEQIALSARRGRLPRLTLVNRQLSPLHFE